MIERKIINNIFLRRIKMFYKFIDW